MTLIRFLRKCLRNKFFIYLLMAIIPSVVISTGIAQHQVGMAEVQYKSQASEYANFHAMNTENFLGETVGRLEMLATFIQSQHKNLNDVKNILQETTGKDPRFSGFYWADTNGDLLFSTNPTTNRVNVSDRSYFQQAVSTRKTSVSDAHIGRITGRFIISIATPVVHQGEVKGVLVASLRFDEIEAEIKSYLKDEMIIVKDGTDKILIKAGSVPGEHSAESSMRVAMVPWKISVFIPYDHDHIFWQNFSLNLIILLTITSILYLSVQYYILKIKVKKEKAQTEIHKLELIGNLAASTAHEIRNPLTGIKGLIKLLSEEYLDKKAQAYFEVIQTEIDRINAIVSEMLVLGKPTAYKHNTYNANDILAEIEPIIHSEANYTNVEFLVDYHPENLPVSCVKDQLKQVILNLAKNSLQAMPHGGKLSINLEKQSDSCKITVADNGVGMDKDQINQAFTPFYTLKKDGSGLGLTVCKRIIDSYSGTIVMNSIPSKGTQVVITLPLAGEK
ncbi:ATP-binding protein [Bacillus sp. S3]|uniref:ATP-binding protein n=1 Tax=Bacillus sp. S3 TaxID=486398 RepID=UPI0016817500|nr:ATP-binding protein [Bacillus sp. S3]